MVAHHGNCIDVLYVVVVYNASAVLEYGLWG